MGSSEVAKLELASSWGAGSDSGSDDVCKQVSANIQNHNESVTFDRGTQSKQRGQGLKLPVSGGIRWPIIRLYASQWMVNILGSIDGASVMCSRCVHLRQWHKSPAPQPGGGGCGQRRCCHKMGSSTHISETRLPRLPGVLCHASCNDTQPTATHEGSGPNREGLMDTGIGIRSFGSA